MDAMANSPTTVELFFGPNSEIMLALLKLHNRILDLHIDESYLPEVPNKYHLQSDCHSLSPVSRTDLLIANASPCIRRDKMQDLLDQMGWVRPPV